VKIIEHVGMPEVGVCLCDAPFGEVVRLAKGGEAFYIVTSPMDGTGRKVLVTLGGGSLKEFQPNTRVVPMNAELHVFGVKK